MRYRFLRFPEGKFKALSMSYDDGCRQDIRLSEMLNKYGIKCTFNINSAYIGKDENDWHLTADEIKKHIIDAGHEVAVHGDQHRANGNIRAIEGIVDVLDCRLKLEKLFGQIIRGMAYPDVGICQLHNGITYEQIKAYLTQLDIAYARPLGVQNHSFALPEDWHKWYPTAHHNDADALELAEKFAEEKVPDYYAARVPRLFYLWGHSYEFDEHNNWERMEQICQKLSGKDDIWYATNIEIYDYVKAYESLIFSADSSIIYNPTLHKIWFEVDGRPYSINPGETLTVE